MKFADCHAVESVGVLRMEPDMLALGNKSWAEARGSRNEAPGAQFWCRRLKDDKRMIRQVIGQSAS